MITIDELLMRRYKLNELPTDHQSNLKTLHYRMNIIRKKYNRPMIITSGYRSLDKHVAIYQQKALLNQAPFKDGIYDGSKVPLRSKHLSGSACDVYDPDAKLYNWCKLNEEFLTQVGVWLEHRQGPWQHFQIQPFGSYRLGGTIWFFP